MYRASCHHSKTHELILCQQIKGKYVMTSLEDPRTFSWYTKNTLIIFNKNVLLSSYSYCKYYELAKIYQKLYLRTD